MKRMLNFENGTKKCHYVHEGYLKKFVHDSRKKETYRTCRTHKGWSNVSSRGISAMCYEIDLYTIKHDSKLDRKSIDIALQNKYERHWQKIIDELMHFPILTYNKNIFHKSHVLTEQSLWSLCAYPKSSGEGYKKVITVQSADYPQYMKEL